MLDKEGFDIWSKDYDKSVEASSREYPFDGYYEVLNHVYNSIECKAGSRILDVGFGTGVLTNKLYEEGARIYGMDFSQGMIDIAKSKMPDGTFIKWDFNDGVPPMLKDMKFDYIVSSYAIHHLNDEKKVEFIGELKQLLNPNGKIIIADVAFENQQDLNACKEVSGDSWDEDEIYMMADKLIKSLRDKEINCSYKQISSCAGILEILDK